MSRGELLTLLQMCVNSSTVGLADLPTWLQEYSAKGTTDSYLMMIAQNNIITSIFVEDADVPMKSKLLKMIMKQSCNGKDGNIYHPSLIPYMEGMSPFTMLDPN